MNLCGSCLCGSVTYEVRLPFVRFVNCHCSRCRKATGAAHATNAFVKPDAFRWTAGASNVVRYDLPTAHSFATCFCRLCGSPLPHLTRSGREVIVPAGSLNDDPGVTPEAHICWSSRAPWYRHGGEVAVSDDVNPTNLAGSVPT
jgi:hypothetical protein